jgi:hypothetical protein
MDHADLTSRHRLFCLLLLTTGSSTSMWHLVPSGADQPRWDACHDSHRRHILGYDGVGAYYCPIAYLHPRKYHRIESQPHIFPDRYRFRSAALLIHPQFRIHTVVVIRYETSRSHQCVCADGDTFEHIQLGSFSQEHEVPDSDLCVTMYYFYVDVILDSCPSSQQHTPGLVHTHSSAKQSLGTH